MIESKEDIKLFKKLILDDRFTSLKSMVNKEINLMSILNVAHRELQHSNFLAWMFNPLESHNKEEYFIKEFIKLYYKENNFSDLGTNKPLSVFDFVKLDLSDIDIKREHKHIDLLLTSESNKLIICVENKIFAGEGKGQLSRYRQYIEEIYSEYDYRIYIYLSLFEQEISEKEQEFWVPVTYDHIVSLLENSLINTDLSDNVRFVISQYITSLKVIMNDNTEIEKIAQDLYKEYKSSFDLVWKYINPSTTSGNNYPAINHGLSELIANDSRVVPAASNKTYTRFKPIELFDLRDHLIGIGLIKPEHDLLKNYLFWFEFNVRHNSIKFQFLIGKHEDQKARERLYESYSKNLKLFTGLKTPLSPQWKFCVKYKVVSKEEFTKYSESEDGDLNKLIEERYNHVVGTIVPQIISEIKKVK